ncbi:MAG: beta-N-acetylhexosaminidase [Bacteroidales bacterium]|jgi:hexosaminidase|nr:beta-N-acetylhexosaminidase [Bacteroidales bacterium]
MKKLFIILCLNVIMTAVFTVVFAANPPQKMQIVPEPMQLHETENHFAINTDTKLRFENLFPCDPTVHYIISNYQHFFGFLPDTANVQDDNCIVFERLIYDDKELGDEGYRISVNNKEIRIIANSATGIFYGYQTLIQLTPADLITQPQEQFSIHGIEIIDKPRFEWRGSHLDVCRHFFPVEYIKKHLDIMALYKLNRFHWHLTDDHGWRIQIDKYPRLTEIGAWRVFRDTNWVNAQPAQPDEKATYGGFYTKEQVRDIVAYAAQRHIEVIPEIEIPGHCSAILVAYPQFACDDYPYTIPVGPYWPPKAILCGGNEAVMQFLKDVMDEIVPLFSSSYIHIGGDEALKGNWEKCPKCLKRMKKLHLKNPEQLQSAMIIEIEQYLAGLGKQIIGWDEILDGGVSRKATIMSWRGKEGAIHAARHGNDAIMAPTSHCYFDYYQGDPKSEPVSIGGYLPLEKAYQFEPVPQDSLTPEQAKHILGGQCNLWSEFLFNTQKVEYMLLPRLLALSEAVWSPKEKRNWEHFKQKITAQKVRLHTMGYNYSDSPVDMVK